MAVALIIGVLAICLADETPTLIWWASSPDAAESIAAALEVVWPNAPIQVQIGTPTAGRAGIHLNQHGLSLKDGETTRFRDGITDPRTAAALVRSWVRTPDIPMVKEQPIESEPAEVVLDEGDVVRRLRWAAVAGPASRRPSPSPAFHFAVQTMTDALLFSTELDTAERLEFTKTDGGLTIRRAGLTAGLRRDWALPKNWDLEASLSVGGRVHAVSDLVRPDVMELWWMPTVSARIRLWDQNEAAPLRWGFGLMVSYDGSPAWALYDEGRGARMRPLTVALEFGGLQRGEKR